MPDPKPNYDLLRDAFQIIDGIPDEKFDLATIVKKPAPTPCGTIACAAGFLAMHPRFNNLGLTLSGSTFGNTLRMKGAEPGDFYTDKLAKLFGFSSFNARQIFGPRNDSGYDCAIFRKLGSESRNKVSDKRLWLHRVIAFLNEKGQPVNQKAIEALQ